MDIVKIHNKEFKTFISSQEIQDEVKNLANQINVEMKGKEVVFIAVLNGAFMFASDIMKSITIPCKISFVKMKSYDGLNSSGKVEELIGLGTNLKGKSVVILEDIIDSGLTIDNIIRLIDDQEPEEVKICTLLYKPQAFKGKHAPNMVGFSIPNAFVVGYGLDYDEHGRNLDAIYQIND